MIRASQQSFVRKDYSALEEILAATLIAGR
jgi:hypothetical protein